MSRTSPQTTSEFSRLGDHHISNDGAERDMNYYVSKYGLEAAMKNVIRLAEALGVECPSEIQIIEHPRISEHPSLNQPLANGKKPNAKNPKSKTSRPEPVFFNRYGERITAARHQTAHKGWETRNAIKAMQSANPRLSRMAALALYRDENQKPRSQAKTIPPKTIPAKTIPGPRSPLHASIGDENQKPRSQAKTIPGPRSPRDASIGQSSWDSRVRNIIKTAAKAGEKIDWQEGHRRALKNFQGSRRAA